MAGEVRKKSPGAHRSHLVGAIAQTARGQRTALLVLGMHRSGTSALARVLSILGGDLPNALMRPSQNNSAGYWESRKIAALNDRLLESAGSAWDDWLEFSGRWYHSPKATQFRSEARSALTEEFGDSRFFVLKDPRICRFPTFWIECLQDAGIRPTVFLLLRNPLEVAASLAARNGFEPEYSYMLWLRHVLEAEAGSRGLPRRFIGYDRLLRERWKVFQDADEALGFYWPRSCYSAQVEIDEFLNNGMRHHEREGSEALSSGNLSPWLRQAYEVFDRWVRRGEEASDHAVLDALRDKLNNAAPAFFHIVRAGRRTAREALEIGGELRGSKDAHERDRRALEEVKGKLKAATAELDRQAEDHAKENKRLRTENARLSEEIARRTSDLESLQQELIGATGALRSAEQAAAETQLELTRMEGALKQRSHENARLEGKLSAAQQSLLAQEGEAEALNDSYRRHVELLLESVREGELAEAALEEKVASLRDELSAQRQRASERSRTDSEQKDVLRRQLHAEARRGARVRAAAAQQLGHAILILGPRSRLPLLGRLQLRRKLARLRRASLFEDDWYLSANPDVANAGVDPGRHYLTDGLREGREPNGALARAGDDEKS